MDPQIAGAPPRADRRTVAAALVTAAVAGVLANEYANPETWLALAPSWSRGVRALLWARAWQAAVLLSLYVVAPLLVARAFGVRPLALGLRLGATPRLLRVPALLIAIASPLAFALSFTTTFQHTYPVFKPAIGGGAVLALWLPLLATMLFAVEFFYRGFLVQMLTPALGRLAIFVMIVPYALTHRDPIEAVGAIGVGLVLGWLAQATGSIWSGWLAHMSVALFIEAIAIWQWRRH